LSAICRRFEAWCAKARALGTRQRGSKEGTVVKQEQAYPDQERARRPRVARPYLVVQFNFAAGGIERIPYEPLKEPKERYLDRALWADLLKISPGLGLRPLFRALEPRKFAKIIEEIESIEGNKYRGNHPDFFEFFELTAPRHADLCRLAGRLNMADGVRYAHVARPGPLPAVDYPNEPGYTGNNPPFNLPQWHHQAAPTPPANPHGGIDSLAAWSAGLDGSGVTYFDVELGWLLDHEDLLLPSGTVVAGEENDPWTHSRAHGAAVLGIVGGKDGNHLGGVGIAPRATPQLVSAVDPDSEAPPGQKPINPELALQRLLELANPGDIVILEQQAYDAAGLLGPLEIDPAYYPGIQALTAKDVIVIEAAGNGDDYGVEHIDLDDWTNAFGRKVFNKYLGGPDYLNSRAIIVSAAKRPGAGTGNLEVEEHWTQGERVDCFAWGRAVYTCWHDGSVNRNVYYAFPDTSAATAIVAGAAIVVQQKARARNSNANKPLTVDEMRGLLTGDWNTAPPPGYEKKIGRMPNLSEILKRIP
jgi:hypothetical protein